MKETDELVIDLEELEEDRRRNEADRRRMLDAYAEWLKARGVVQPSPKHGARGSSARRTKARR